MSRTCSPRPSGRRGSRPSARTSAASPRSGGSRRTRATSRATASGSSTPCREGVGKAWFAHRLDGRSRTPIGTPCASVRGGACGSTAFAARSTTTATDWVQEQLDRFRVEITNTTGATRDAYTRVREQTIVARGRDGRAARQRASGHQGSERRRPAAVRRPPLRRCRRGCSRSTSTTGSAGSWRRRSLGPGFVAWYRNPGSATPASLRIAYQNDEGEWASLQPDFIVVSRRSRRNPRRLDRRPAWRPPRRRSSQAPGPGGVRRAVR